MTNETASRFGPANGSIENSLEPQTEKQPTPDAAADLTKSPNTSNKSAGDEASKFRFTPQEQHAISEAIIKYGDDKATLDETIWRIEAVINEGWETCED